MTVSQDRLPAPSARRWIWVAVLAIVVALAAFYLWTHLRSPGAASAGHAAPAFSAPVLGGGGRVSLASLRGKPVVLNFWASWCAPCADEAPLLNRAYRRYHGRIAFLGVDSHDARSDAIAFLRRHRVRYPSVFDSGGSIYRDYELTGQPETFFIGDGGQIVRHVPGELTPPALRQGIEALLR